MGFVDRLGFDQLVVVVVVGGGLVGRHISRDLLGRQGGSMYMNPEITESMDCLGGIISSSLWAETNLPKRERKEKGMEI